MDATNLKPKQLLRRVLAFKALTIMRPQGKRLACPTRAGRSLLFPPFRGGSSYIYTHTYTFPAGSILSTPRHLSDGKPICICHMHILFLCCIDWHISPHLIRFHLSGPEGFSRIRPLPAFLQQRQVTSIVQQGGLTLSTSVTKWQYCAHRWRKRTNIIKKHRPGGDLGGS